MASLRAFLTVLLLISLGCSDDDGPRHDGGLVDAGMDGSTPDGGLDGGSDGGSDVDGGTDAGPPPECVEDEDCSDDDVCTGLETCVRGFCRPGVPLRCFDGFNCTTDGCDPVDGCTAMAEDSDSDGADDCNDCAPDDPEIHPGATEACNDVDDDCDTLTDEDLVLTRWSDCDGDGFPPLDAAVIDGCEEPSPDETGCGTATAAWTARDPDVVSDCADGDARAFPGQTMFFSTAVAGADFGLEFDFDCDEEPVPENEEVGGCSRVDGACDPKIGWQEAVPECGMPGTFITGCTAACAPIGSSRRQSCR